MTTLSTLRAGAYRYIPGVRQYSAGVRAEPGYRLERARFHRPVPLREGFARIEAHLQSLGRPNAAFCACELRSPAPFTEAGFRAFNDVYIGTLQAWGIMTGDANPVARSNVCPDVDPPAEPSFHAFTYTVPDADAAPSFVVAGSGEAPEGLGDYRDHAVRLNDTSPDGLREKARWVLGEMERRLAAMGFDWSDTTATQLYTVYDIHALMADEIAARGAMRAGLTWHLNRPPIVGLDYEMDCRGVAYERVLAAD